MALGVDLRRLHIKTDDEAMEFLNIIESKIPQIKQVLKKNRLEKQSLISRVKFEKERAQSVDPVAPTTDVNASVSERLTQSSPAADRASSRIEQLRNATKVQPGEIGKLDVPVEQTKAPAVDPEDATTDDNIVDPSEVVEENEEKVVDPEGATEPKPKNKKKDKIDEQVKNVTVSKDDVTPVGKMIAQKTKGKVEPKLSK